VRPDRPSVTARGVALTRSRMERPSTPDGDPDAEQQLYAGLGPVHGFRMGGRRGHRIESRTQFFDREVLDALTAGVPQIVLVGAGYDGRALRFRHPDAHYFEVDHPATQADKRRRVEQLGVPLDGITFVEVDLMTARVDPALAAAGHRADEPSLFVCEGLLLYLTREVVVGLLTDLRTRAAPGSRLALSTRERLPGKAGLPTPRDLWRRLLLRFIGEPRRSSYELGGVARLLEETGWMVAHEVHRDEVRRRGPGRRGMLVLATPAALS
jgi:methyltransferase (TIGR00027 family)